MKLEQPATNAAATGNGPDPTSYDLLDYLLVLARQKKMIIAVTMAAALFSVCYSLALPNIYTARTMFLPGEEDKGIMGTMMAQIGGLAGGVGDALGGGKPRPISTSPCSGAKR